MPDYIDVTQPLPGRKVSIKGKIYLAISLFEVNPSTTDKSLTFRLPDCSDLKNLFSTDNQLIDQKIRVSGKVYFMPISYLVNVSDKDRDLAMASYLAKQATDLKSKHTKKGVAKNKDT